MIFLQAISRVVLGLVFIFSGFLKLIDPVGTALKVTEYLNAASLDFLSGLSPVAAITLATLEFMLGIAILLGLRMRLASVGIFIMMIFFSLVTLLLVIFDPITDCGCFGELIKLTNMQSFLKNMVLLLLSLFIFLRRKSFVPIGPAILEWFLMGFFFIISLSLSIYSYRNLPLMDFSDFKSGTDIVAQLDDLGSSTEYKATYIYKKGDEIGKFTLDNLPDSTWTFVDSETELLSGSSAKSMDFFIRSEEGEYMTDYFLSLEEPLFISVITNIGRLGKKEWERLNTFAQNVVLNGGRFIFLTSETNSDVQEVRERYGLTADFYWGDYKNLITLIRSNGGVVYLNDGCVVNKWAWRKVPQKRLKMIMDQDPDLYNAKVVTREKIRGEIWISAIILLIIIIRTFCRLYLKGTESREAPTLTD